MFWSALVCSHFFTWTVIIILCFNSADRKDRIMLRLLKWSQNRKDCHNFKNWENCMIVAKKNISFFLLTVIYSSSLFCPLIGSHFLRQPPKKIWNLFLLKLVSIGAVLSCAVHWLGIIFVCWSMRIVVVKVLNFWLNVPFLAWKSHMTQDCEVSASVWRAFVSLHLWLNP